MMCILNYDQIWIMAIKMVGAMAMLFPKKEKVAKNGIHDIIWIKIKNMEVL